MNWTQSRGNIGCWQITRGEQVLAEVEGDPVRPQKPACYRIGDGTAELEPRGVEAAKQICESALGLTS